MTEFTVSIAEIPIRIRAIYPQTQVFCRRFLCEKEPLFEVEITQQDFAVEQAFSARTAAHRSEPVKEYPLPYLETLAISRKIANRTPQYGAVLFHGAAVAVDGEVYLFTAKSGTGKTTHIRYWLEQFGDRATVVNGDKPFLKITENGVFACGSPWQGKENYGSNLILPLKAVCLLQRDKTDHIERVSFGQNLAAVLRQTYQPPTAQGMEQTLELIPKLAAQVPLYRLGCTMNPNSALVSYNGMNLGRLKLEQYDEKLVRVVDIDGKVHLGFVDIYTQPNDNDPEGEEAIALDTGVWLNETAIKSIESIH